MPRATKALREQRIDAVVNLLIASASRHVILNWIAQHGWGITERQADNYIALATERLGSLAQADKTFELGRTVARLQLLFGKALAAGDLQTALQCLRSLAQLLGLNAASELELCGQLDLHADREELAQRLAELYASGRFQGNGEDDGS
jgi:hypothetical protein